MDKVLILGINGFTGRHFQEYIYNNHLEEYYTFIGVDKEIGKWITIDCMKIDLLEGKILQELIREEMPAPDGQIVKIYQSKRSGI